MKFNRHNLTLVFLFILILLIIPLGIPNNVIITPSTIHRANTTCLDCGVDFFPYSLVSFVSIILPLMVIGVILMIIDVYKSRKSI